MPPLSRIYFQQLGTFDHLTKSWFWQQCDLGEAEGATTPWGTNQGTISDPQEAVAVEH